ncbi:hypothetical protein KC19_2G210300 [Ceratodon purpureus]|uniref:Uncharacterized protein n=1 Tax=Ceratodon purpureus TaxID=3225 RepID=A0A8T0IWD1_CERPU|nr:hypothetical protein KC19_2G210300 [Ceratodon purpureus]
MAPSEALTGSDSCSTFSVSDGTTSLYDSRDSWAPRSLSPVFLSRICSRCGAEAMASPHGQHRTPFPARGIQEGDMGPGIPSSSHQNQAEYERWTEEGFDPDLHDDHEDGRYEHSDGQGGDRTDVHYDPQYPGGAVPGGGNQRLQMPRHTRATPSTISQPHRHNPCTPSQSRHGALPSEFNVPTAVIRSEPYGPNAEVSWRVAEEDQGKRRRIQRQFTKPYFMEMANAHAERRSPVVHVPTTTTGEPIGLKCAWHRQVRLIARQCMDQSIRSYKGKKGDWWKAVDKVYAALGEVFTYDHPLCAKYLSRYLKGAIKNDRLEWKEFFISSQGKQHEKRPDEAFRTLRKYWMSVAGKAESEQMAALRTLGSQKSSSHGSQGPTSTSTPRNQALPYMGTTSIPSGGSGMEESALRASSSARHASTRGSAPDARYEEDDTPLGENGLTTPEYNRRHTSRGRVNGDSPLRSSCENVRISQLETRVVDLASQVTQNLAMVTEVLHTQRDFKDILLRLVNSSSGTDGSPSQSPVLNEALADPSLDERTRSQSLATEVPEAVPEPARDHQPSWMSEETVLLTPNTRNNLRPIKSRNQDMEAVSTDISDQSVANGSVNESAYGADVPSADPASSFRVPCSARKQGEPTSHGPPPPPLQDPHNAVASLPSLPGRGRGLPSEFDSVEDDSSHNIALKFPPRAGNDAIAVNKLCYITHPDSGDTVIAEGKTGGSWKARAQKLGNLCGSGEQMVQVHRILIPNMPLLHVEDRQSFLTVDDAVVKASGSNIFVKWNARYLHKRNA